MNNQVLVAQALEARKNAYAPYSQFAVGACVRGESGDLYTGANVENASYGLTMCAERVAVFKAVEAGERKIRAVAVVSPTAAPPCGACRQVLAEFGDKDLEVMVADLEGETKTYTLGQLIPESFTRDYLTKKGDDR